MKSVTLTEEALDAIAKAIPGVGINSDEEIGALAVIKLLKEKCTENALTHNGKQIDASKMRVLAPMIEERIPGLGFALFTFEFATPGITHYISNAQRPDMIKALEETLLRFKNKQDFLTPEGN
jgi:hypothetical protein